MCRRSTCDATAGTACYTTSSNEDKTPPDFAGMPAVNSCDVSRCRRLLFSHIRTVSQQVPAAMSQVARRLKGTTTLNTSENVPRRLDDRRIRGNLHYYSFT